jgi:hypothetical protein
MDAERDIRASDADRERVATALRQHYAEGRLVDAELAERIDQAYASRTLGQLRELTLDLPEVTPSTPPVVAPDAGAPASGSAPVPPARRGSGLRAMWTTWAVVVAINLAVWLLVSVSSGELTYFWPMWVAGPWGAVLAAITLANRLGDAD